MLKAILFDFDGVILDSEEYHFEAFQRVFEEEGVSLTRKAYYRDCLGFNDVECFRWGLKEAGKIDGTVNLSVRALWSVEGFMKDPSAVAWLLARTLWDLSLKATGLV